MPRQKLTDLTIQRLPHPESDSVKYWDTVLPGFGVRVTKRTKSFFVTHGTPRKLHTLGRYPSLSLKMARHEAKRLQMMQTTETPVPPFSGALSAFLAETATRARPATVDSYYYRLKTLPVTEIAQITPTVVPATPQHQMAAKVFLNWCVRQGYLDRNPLQNHRISWNSRDRVLSDDEIARLWRYDHPPYSDMVKLLILTGQRRNQVWKFDPAWVQDDTITFPAHIMKANRSHTIPLIGDWKPVSFNSWSKAKQRMDAHTGVTNYVLHDFRRYFSTTMAKLGVPLPITEQLLDHRSTVSGVAAVYNLYQFLPEMRDALHEYQKHLQTVTA